MACRTHTNKTRVVRSAVKILVVDDHPLILEALHHVLRQLDRTVDVYDARTARDGRELVARHADAGLLLLDLALPDTDGFAFLSALRAEYPALPVVVLSASDRREDILRSIDLGAMGFIPKTSSNQVMLQALRLVLSGGVYLPPVALGPRAGIEPSPPPQASEPAHGASARDLGLTARQAQVLQLILQGKPNKVICRELGLAEGTVKIHVAAILRALNVSTRTQAVIEASRLGLHPETGGPAAAALQQRP
jgi:DNA-binding NarL/FixJ family response regulator